MQTTFMSLWFYSVASNCLGATLPFQFHSQNKTHFLLYCLPIKKPTNIQTIFILFLLVYSRGGQTTAWGQKSARQDIFKCPLNFFEKLHLLNSIDNYAILEKSTHLSWN